MIKIVILSHVVFDEIHRRADTSVRGQIGGAGAYAAVGASLATAAGTTVIAAGVGRCDRRRIERWSRARGIDPCGLFDVGERSPRTRIEYFPDGERAETPVSGIENFNAHTPLPRHIRAIWPTAAGAYLFHAHEDAYWEEVARWRDALTGPLMWEISRDCCQPRHLARVRELAAGVDVLSINLAEARELLGRGLTGLPAALADIAPVVLLRCGGHGSLVLAEGNQLEVPALRVVALDPTGGGNSYSGAFLGAYASTGSLGESARVATAAAAVVVSAVGTPGVDDSTRADVAGKARTLITFTGR